MIAIRQRATSIKKNKGISMITNRCQTILKWTKGEESNMRVELSPTKRSSEVHSTFLHCKVAFYEAVANICKIK